MTKMESNRLEDLVIHALEWANEVSQQVANDLIGGMGITSDELAAVGYDADNFPSLHRAAGIEEIRAFGIKWDVDEEGDSNYLPTNIVIPESVKPSISDWFSDEYGFCHDGYKLVCLTGDDLKEEEEKLKRAIHQAGVDAAEEFLGHPLDSDAIDIWSEMNDCLSQMPDEEYLNYLVKYCC